MARKLRIEQPGGLYHVFSRGNYRRDVFETNGAAHSFVEALEEAVSRHGWRLQAYVLMRNHFHLVMETPEPNLTQGMHWLLSTVAIRFNRYRSEQGHLFQGRFHALPIEDYRVMSQVVDYVHLNPVRAHVVPPDRMTDFAWSSLFRFFHQRTFAGLEPAGALAGRGWDDSPAGWAGYVDYLIQLATNLDEQKRMGFEGFSSGWAIGSNEWRRALAKEQASLQLVAGLAANEAAALREERWRRVLDDILRERGRTREQALIDRKSAEWKIRLALEVREKCGASISWLAQELRLGTQGTARSKLSVLRRKQKQQNSARPRF